MKPSKTISMNKKRENEELKTEIYKLKRKIEQLKYFNRVLSYKLREIPDF